MICASLKFLADAHPSLPSYLVPVPEINTNSDMVAGWEGSWGRPSWLVKGYGLVCMGHPGFANIKILDNEQRGKE